MTNDKYVMFFRSEINQNLIVDTDYRIDIMRKVDDLKNLNNLEGINFFNEWKKLKDKITQLWQKDLDQGIPFFKMESKLIDQLAFYLDFVAQFFLYNGNEEDDDYLRDVDEFFKQHKLQRGEKESLELFRKAFK